MATAMVMVTGAAIMVAAIITDGIADAAIIMVGIADATIITVIGTERSAYGGLTPAARYFDMTPSKAGCCSSMPRGSLLRHKIVKSLLLSNQRRAQCGIVGLRRYF
jgi:hypothetical protein